MTDTWIVATMVALVAGALGFFVVLRGASFEAHALPLGAFPGAAAAAVFGVSEYAGLLAFSCLGVIGITWFARRDSHQVATALILILLLGLGALLLSRTTEYEPAVFALLFGEVLGVGRADVAPVGVLCALALAFTAILYRPLLLSSISPDLAQAGGVRTGLVDILFLADLALATATALPVVGALLVFSLMVGPPSAARMMADTPLGATLISIGLALGTVWGSIVLAYLSDWPVGFFVGTASALCYGVGRLWPRGRARSFRARRAFDRRSTARAIP